MSRITVISVIKNSADVIEAFIRGNACIADNFMIADNMSTDRTMSIIEKLQAEGFQIEVFSDRECSHMQSMKMNLLMKQAVEEYDPDIIIPLDDDEIMSAYDRDIDLRAYILGLSEMDQLYHLNCRVYFPTEYDDASILSVPERIQYHFIDTMPTYKKIIITKALRRSKDIRIVQGNHDVYMENDDIIRIDLDHAFLAHYPVRSKEQILSKALVSVTNMLAMCC